jgi:hypothetical protein
LAKINAYKKRIGWSFPSVSSYGSDFNFDYHVSFTPEQIAEGKAYYNYEVQPNTLSDEVVSSVFYKNETGEVFHTDSRYSRGVDMFNGAYRTSTLCPKAAMRAASNSRWSGYAGTISIEALRRWISTSPRLAGTKKMFEDSRGSATMIATRRETSDACARSGNAAAFGAADWLCLAAAPTFAIVALLVLRGGPPDMLCSATRDASPLSGMVRCTC